MTSLIDPSWELIDPNPDIHSLFIQFNYEFFHGKLDCVELKWSKRMTQCAGLCRYKGRLGGCTVVLSEPLLKLRPRKDLIETLLHEMIHAYLFVADNNREREAHGPRFLQYMNDINRKTGTNITVYHSFHGEVSHYKTHWWKCDGPCQNRSPFFGIVKRSMNRAPGPSDNWHAEHKRNCGGAFHKIKEPEAKAKTVKGHILGDGSLKKTQRKKLLIPPNGAVPARKIQDFFHPSGSNYKKATPSTPSSTFVPSMAASQSNGNSQLPSSFSSYATFAGSHAIPLLSQTPVNSTGIVASSSSNSQATLKSASSIPLVVLDSDDENDSPPILPPKENDSPQVQDRTYNFKKDQPVKSDFVAFSGKGYVLGTGSINNQPKRTRYE